MDRSRLGMWARVRLASAFLLSFSCCAIPATDQQGSTDDPSALDLGSYQRELNKVEEALKNPQKMETFRRSLPNSWQVKLRDQTYFVSTKEISDALRQIQTDPKKPTQVQLEIRLKWMLRQADELEHSSPTMSLAQVHDKLNTILSRSEYQDTSGPSTWEVIRARINRWVLEHIIRLLSLLHISKKTGNAIAWGVLFLVVLLLFYVVYRWLVRSSKTGEFRAEVEPRTSDTRHWVQEALAAAERRDFREAIHCAYWASIARLEDIRILPQDRARTPRESLRLLVQHPKEQGVLQNITGNFELIWYGYRTVSAADWAGTKEQLEKMGCLQDSIAPTVPS